jgi:CubicO group peptidase (beta-lactamase class C family)
MPIAAPRPASAAAALAVLGLALIGSGAGAAAPDFGPVERFVESERARLGLKGAALLVGVDGAVVYEHYFGSYDAETSLPIASATKWPSAAAVMTLVDASVIDLDAPASTWLPELKGRKGEITVRQMLSLTSGMRRDVLFAPRKHLNLAEFTKGFATRGRLVGDPGADFRYSGTSFQLAGRIAEIASGMDFRSFFRERLAAPCKMDDFDYDLEGAQAAPLLFGGASSTLADYGRFLAMIAGGGHCGTRRVLSAKALLAMRTNQTGDLPLRFAGPERMAAQSRYGLGCWLDRVDERGLGLRTSSPGSFGTMPWIDYERRLFGVLLQVNPRDHPGGFIDPFALVERVHAAIDGPSPGEQPTR